MEFDPYFKTLKKGAVLNFIWIMCSCVGVLLSVWILIVQRSKWFISIALVLTILVISLLYKKSEHRFQMGIKEFVSPFSFRVPSEIIDRIVQGGIGESVDKNAYCLLTETRFGRIRELIQIADYFDPVTIGKERKRINQAINQKYSISNRMPRFGNWLRINLVICDTNSEALRSWVNHRTEQLLRRNEAIINAAIVKETQQLLFPSLNQVVSLDLFRVYERAFAFLTEQLVDIENST